MDMEGTDPTDVDPARQLRDAADAVDAGNSVEAQMFASRALDALLNERADDEDLISELGEALEEIEGMVPLEQAAADDDSGVPQRWSEGGLRRSDIPALLSREFAAMPTTELTVTVEPERPGVEDHHYMVTFELEADGLGE